MAYAFRARHHAPQRRLAWAGLVLSLVVLILFALGMLAAVMDLIAVGLR